MGDLRLAAGGGGGEPRGDTRGGPTSPRGCGGCSGVSGVRVRGCGPRRGVSVSVEVDTSGNGSCHSTPLGYSRCREREQLLLKTAWEVDGRLRDGHRDGLGED